MCKWLVFHKKHIMLHEINSYKTIYSAKFTVFSFMRKKCKKRVHHLASRGQVKVKLKKIADGVSQLREVAHTLQHGWKATP